MPSCFRSLFNRLPELSLLNGLHLIGIHGSFGKPLHVVAFQLFIQP